jgi:hypothetical protein
MEMKRKVNKIVKIAAGALAGTAMLGSVFSGAFAAMSLAQLPSPFINDAGQFDAYVVVGEAAKVDDVVAGLDVAAAFAQKAVSAAGSTGTTDVLGGDAWLVDKSGDHMALSDFAEQLGSVTKSEIPTLLKGGSVSTDSGDYSYDEYLALPGNGNSSAWSGAKFVFDRDSKDSTNVPHEYLKFAKDVPAYTYKMAFSSAMKATKDSTTLHLTDLENEKLNILGKEYTVTKALVDSNNVKLTLELMGGSNEVTQDAYTTQTYTVGGKEYTVKITSLGTGSGTGNVLKATMIVNGETLSGLKEGDSKKLSDGTEIGVKTLIQVDAGKAASDQVTFYLGADKLTLIDGNITDSSFGGTKYKVGAVEVDGTDVMIAGSYSSNTYSIGTIAVKYTPSDDVYVPAGSKLSDKVDAGKVFGGFDFQFQGLTTPAKEEIKFYKANDYEYKMKYTAKDGATFDNVLFVRTNVTELGGVDLGAGQGTSFHKFGLVSGTAVGDEEYFYVTRGEYSHIFQLKDVTSEQVEVLDKNTGETVKVSYTGTTGVMYFKGYTVALTAINDTANSVKVDMTDSTTGPYLYTQDGAKITFGGFTAATDVDTVNLTTEKLEGGATGDSIVVKLYNNGLTSSGYLDTSFVSATGVSALVGIGDTSKYAGYSTYGVYIEDDQTSDANVIKMVYPDDQLYAKMYVTGAKVTVSKATTGAVTINYINAATGIGKTDTEVGTPSKNVILVGGPYANKLVGQLADAGKATKAADYKVDTALVELVENAFGSNDALIVAGYSAADTKLAGKVLAARLGPDAKFSDKMTGTKAVLSTKGVSTIDGVTFM